jgi:hypothetical protein
MKQTVCLFLMLGFVTLGLSALDLRLGPVASLTNTRAVELIAEGPTTWFGEGFRPEVGLEFGLAGSRYQTLVPVGLMWETYLEKGWSWGAAVHGLAGASVEPSPTFLWGAEGELRGEWSWSPGIGLGLSAGARYSNSSWEFPVHAILEVALGGEDTLEPAEKKE